MGILIPPSIILVIYGSIAEASVARLFAASMIPGLVLLLLYLVVAWVLAGRAVDAENQPKPSALERVKALLKPWHFILLSYRRSVGSMPVSSARTRPHLSVPSVRS